MAEPSEKLAQKSNGKKGTLMRGLTAAITPNAKKTSKKGQDPAKDQGREKEGTVEVFGEGPCVPGPSTEGTLIVAVNSLSAKSVLAGEKLVATYSIST